MKNKRKVMKLNRSVGITLPSEWTKRFNIKAGDDVIVKENARGSLEMTPDNYINEIEGVLLEDTVHISREIVKHALLGVKTIIVQSNGIMNRDTLNQIRNAVDLLPQLEIIEEEPSRVVIQTISYKSVPIEKLVLRALRMVSSMFSEKGNLDAIYYTHNALKRVYFIVVGHARSFLNTGRYVSEEDAFTPIDAVNYIQIASKTKIIAKLVKEFYSVSEPARLHATLLIEEMDGILNRVINAYYKTGIEREREINSLYIDLKTFKNKVDNCEQHAVMGQDGSCFRIIDFIIDNVRALVNYL